MTTSENISKADDTQSSMQLSEQLPEQLSENEPLFSIKNHESGYQHQQVFSDISLTINYGEKVAIIGSSGVGKTSLLNVLHTQQSENIAFCQQQLNLIPNLSAYNNIYLGRLNEFSTWKNLCNLVSINKEQWSIIEGIALRLDIDDQLRKSITQLSGGQQQRVAIARVLYQNKAIFFGDEPVSSLDPQRAKQVLQLLIEQHDCCVVALHDRQQALEHFDRIIGLKRDSDNNSHIVIDQRTSELQLSDLDELYR